MAAITESQAHIDVALTNLSISYLQETPPVSDMLFPRVTVDKQSGKFWRYNKSDMWRSNAKMRAPGADFAQAKFGLDTDTFYADQYAVEYFVPDETVGNADQGIQLLQSATRSANNDLTLKKDLQFVADFVKTGVWATDKVGTTDFVKWSDVSSDPAGDMQAAMETILGATGDLTNVRFKLLIGSIVRARLINHPDAIDRIKYTSAATPAAINGALAAWLGVDELVVARRRYTTSAEGAASATYAAVVDDDALLVAVADAPGLETPSAGYTMEWNEPGKGPMYVERYRFEPKKSEVVRGVTYFDQKLVASDLGVFWSDCVD